jgi:hypothetical protein
MSDAQPQPLSPKAVISELIKRNAVDFDAVGSVLAKFGPSLALTGDPSDPTEWFCGTGPHYFRCFQNPPGEGLSSGLQTLGEQLSE